MSCSHKKGIDLYFNLLQELQLVGAFEEQIARNYKRISYESRHADI